MFRSTQLIVLSEVLSSKSLFKNIPCLKTIHDCIEFPYEECKLTITRALWNQGTRLSFVEKSPLQ